MTHEAFPVVSAATRRPAAKGERLPLRERAAQAILFAIVFVAPLVFGAVHEITVAFCAAAMGCAALLMRPRPLPGQSIPLLIGGGVAAGLVLFVGAAHLFDAGLNDSLMAGLREPGGATVVPYAAERLLALGPIILNTLCFAVSFNLGLDAPFALRLVRAVCLAASLHIALTGLLYIFDPSMLLFVPRPAYLGFFTGGFVNRNTAGLYFGTAAVCLLFLVSRRTLGLFGFGAKPGLAFFMFAVMPVLRRNWAILLLFLTMVAAVLASGSRAATLLTLGATLFFAWTRLEQRWRTSPLRLPALKLLVAVVSAVFLLFGDTIGNRFATRSLVEEGRWPVYGAVLSMIADHPLWGTGPGAFAEVFPLYRPADLRWDGVWDRAHSTPLELAAEVGLPTASAVFLWWAFMMITLWRCARGTSSGKGIALLGFTVALLATAHSLVDFSLQIPGYAVTFFALAGAICGRAFTASRG